MFMNSFNGLRPIGVFLFPLFVFVLLIFPISVVAENEGISADSPGGQNIYLYKDYHALVVGVGNYDKWPSLPNAVKDARDVSWLLKRLGFEVTLVTDPSSRELKRALDDFVQEAGQEQDRGVVFYYRGNGETRTLAGGPKLGWIIPRDCPLARDDPKGFAGKAISTEVIASYSEQIKSRHVLMLFDSSLSGEVFSIEQPVLKIISDKSLFAVRQYIIAGGEDEPNPDRSVFKRYLFKGLKGEADFIRDGYVTGSELGVYLLDRVVKKTRGRQHTQYGKIGNPELARGDFVFDLKGAELDIGRLFVKTDPEGARVRILNIGPRFHQGMELDSGSYHVEVSAAGHETMKQWIKLEFGEDKTINIQLSKLREERKEEPIARPPGKILDSFTNSMGMEFVGIPPGSFVMGSPGGEIAGIDDEKKHQVTLTKKYYIQATEVTIGHFRQFVEATGHKTGAETAGGCYVAKGRRWKKKRGSNWKNPGFGGAAESQTDDHPVTCITWRDVQAFIDWINQLEGKRFGLPTEAEWEYATRAGTDTPFAFGRCLSTDQANFGGPGQHFSDCKFSDCKGVYRVNRKGPIKVGSLAPNPWKLYDMHGNVSEWVQDWYGPYSDGSVTDPKGLSSGTERVIRGGHWSTDADGCRSAKRGRFLPKIPSNAIGFRLVMRP
jgi:formylglycine-generating enzyme required for sulfatase activity